MTESFIQFYTPARHRKYIDLGNGFSDVLSYCKNRGEVHWVEHHGLIWASTYKMINNMMELDKFNDVPLPEHTDIVYISALYTTHLYQAYVWAKQYPEIQFVVGGPVLRSNIFELRGRLPKNLILSTKTLEELFEIDEFSCKWELNIPDVDERVVFSYTIDTSCYWGKCIYCNFSMCKDRIRQNPQYEFKGIKEPKNIRINTSSTTPKQFKDIIPNLPVMDDTTYEFYMRFGNCELEALKSVDFGTNKFKLMSGIEFPSDRMLKYMNKGITTQEIYNMLEFLENHQSNVSITTFIILGWNELTAKDIMNLQTYMDKLPNNCHISMTRLYARPYTKIHNIYEPYQIQQIGPFYLGFIPKIDKDKLELSRIARRIVNQYDNVMDYTKGLL